MAAANAKVMPAFGNSRTRPGVLSGTCMPAASISIAKPISARNAIVGCVASTHPKPVAPTATPASTSPTTTGRANRRDDPSSGPPNPASTISSSTPKLIPAV